ncbi:MAG: lumen targeted protein [Monoraphidium minutum]|nr:MAG: lumen targeted protein [Monoraphidium minutum]
MSVLQARGMRTAAPQQRSSAAVRPQRARCTPFVAAQARRGSSGPNGRQQPQPEQQEQQQQPGRRAALLSAAAGLAGAALLPLAPAPAARAAAAAAASAAPEGLKAFEDKILAYRFNYPVATASGQPLSLVLTRPPEKYSSAAPLSADARQRIVSELFDLRRYVTVSLTVGPASGVLKDAPQDGWTAKDVALTVLIDRSTARLSTGQRTALNDVEFSRMEERDGQRFYVYEHRSQGSATSYDRSMTTFRHALAVTTVRAGMDGSPYLYTLNLSCPESLWEDLSPRFLESVQSFRLLPPTRDYIPPDKDPWKFF